MSVAIRAALFTTAALAAGSVIAATAAAQESVSFAQLPGAQGCHVQAEDEFDDVDEGCTETRGLIGAEAVEVSPDQKHVYVASRGFLFSGSNAVVTFTRDQQNGALSFGGCVSDSGGDGRAGTDGFCVDGDALLGASDLDLSPDGRFLYVASAVSGALAWFERDAETGALTQRGCLKALPRRDRCIQSMELESAAGVAISADGRHVYVTGEVPGAVTAFARDQDTGALAQVMCVSDSGSDGACMDGTGLEGARSVVVAPDGGDVYVTAVRAGAVTSYRRDATTGVLRPSGCLLDRAPEGGSCASAPTLRGAQDAVLTPDGRHLLVAASADSALSVFARNADTGRLSFQSCLRHQAGQPGDEFDGDSEDVDSGTQQCRPASALGSVSRVAVSRDGRGVFAVSPGDYLAAFRRDLQSGDLQQFACAEEEQTDASCTRVQNLSEGRGLAASEDGRNLYVATSRGVSIFAASVAITTRAATLRRHGSIRVRLACPRARTRACRGRLSAGRPRGSSNAARYRLRPGARTSRALRLPAAVRRAVRRRGKTQVTLVARPVRDDTRVSTRRIVVRGG